LNEIVHPRVREWMTARTAEAFDRGAQVVIQDVPLLFENGLEDLFSATVLVYARPQTQVERLVEQRGLSRDRAASILAAQMAIDEKRPLATFVIDNDGGLEETRRQVEEVWARVRPL
jgi:dephospho-CoA kinase